MSSAAAPRSAEEQARFEKALTEVFEQRISFNKLLGLKVLSMQPGDVRLGFEMQPQLIGHFAYGRLHGGVISTALDSLSGLALMLAIAQRHPGDSAAQVMQRFVNIGTIDLRVDYLHQGIGKQFTATARITRLGGRIASVQMTLENEAGLLIATGAGSYVIS